MPRDFSQPFIRTTIAPKAARMNGLSTFIQKSCVWTSTGRLAAIGWGWAIGENTGTLLRISSAAVSHASRNATSRPSGWLVCGVARYQNIEYLPATADAQGAGCVGDN